ncbi:PilZ domain-containing protein [Granulosicoccaceae sp. 1_MG-2023]|nr:PilZ domain-containing protein [Granulosicoccaceae sp. 1_MG-2023]
MSAPDNDRREAFRVRATLVVQVRPVAEAELQRTVDAFEEKRARISLLSHMRYGAEKYLPEMRMIERKHPEIAAYLKFLEQQIEYVSVYAIPAGGAEDSADRGLQTMDLSATGVQLHSRLPGQPGDHYELILQPEPGIQIMALARVVRFEAAAEERPESTALEFTTIVEEDKEALIKSLYRMQMKQLQRAHNEEF